MDKKILITGGNGYIGSEIVKRLISLKVKPYLLIRSTSNLQRIQDVLSSCEVITCDIINSSEVEKAISTVKPQVIFHLASSGVYSYTDETQENRNAIIDSNIKGTLNLINSSRAHGVETFIHTGSCFEYGSKDGSFTEEDVCNPVNLYGVAKCASTELVKMYHSHYKFPAIILRPFTVYGPLEGQGRFITTAIRNCLSNQDIKIIEEKVVRDYVFIDDVVDAYLKVLDQEEKLIGEIINVSTGISWALEDVAKLIVKLTRAEDVKIQKGAFPLRSGEVISLVGSAKKAKDLFDFEAKNSLEEGLRKTIKSIKQSP